MRSDAKPPTAGTNHRLKQSGALAIAALLAMAIVVATAFAGKDVVQTIGDGNGGNDPGTFENNVGLDVNDPEVADASEDPYGNPTDGYIYVADEDNHRVEVFDSEHDFVFTFGGGVNGTEPAAPVCPRPGFPEDNCAQDGNQANEAGGYLDDLQDVAIDQSDGSVYVMDEDNARVQKFSASGEFLWTVGNNVNADELPVPDLCLAGDICKAGTNDTAENGFTTNSTGHIAVDPNAPFDLYVADEDHSRIQVFNSEGEFQRMYGYGVQDGEVEPQVCEAGCQNGITDGGANVLGQLDEPIDVDVDDAGRIYVLDDDNENVVRFEDGTTFAGPEVFAEADLSGSPKPGRIEISPGPEAAASDDAIYVTKEQEGETRVLELDETGAVTDTHMQGAGIGISSFAGGLAVNRPLGELYVSDDNPDYVFVLDDPLPPVGLVVDPITVKDDTTATFTGTVDPEGGLVTGCAFEYSTDSEFNVEVKTANEPACDSLEPGGGPQAVGAEVEELIPNATYYVRLLAERPFVSESGVTSEAQTFDTDSVPPVVGSVGAIQIQDTSARFAAEINPKNSAAGYFFEYGTTPALGKTTPPLAIGGGNEPVVVSQVVGGLVKDSPYYLRLRATNAFGDTLSEQQTFHTRALPSPLPANRAYEMVSPPDKNGSDASRIVVAGLEKDAAAAPNGNALAFCSLALFGEIPPQIGNAQCAGYLSRRTPSGWVTRATFPRFCRVAPSGVTSPLQIQKQLLSLNLDRAATAKFEPANCPISSFDPTAPITAGEEEANLYLQDLHGDVNDPASYRLLAPEIPINRGFLDASDDFSHVLFLSVSNQTPEPDSPPQNNFKKIYEWIELGPDCGVGDLSYRPELGACLRLVSKDTGGEPFTSGNSGLPAAGGHLARNAVTNDGSRIFFNNVAKVSEDGGVFFNCETSPDCKLFLREEGATTIEVGASECSENCDALDSHVRFEWATSDGSVALIHSCDKLTDNAIGDGSTFGENSSCQLYRWDRNLPPGSRLTSLQYDGSPVGMSENGQVIYTFSPRGPFVGSLVGLSDFPVRRWQWNNGSPTSEVIANLTVPGGEFSESGDYRRNADYRFGQVTPDGKYVVVNVNTPLDPVADKDEDRDIYRWDEDGGWVCVSCQPPGAASLGEANLGGAGTLSVSLEVNNRTIMNQVLEPKISSDGERIFFDTPDSLVPEDTNHEVACVNEGGGLFYTVKSCSDVYEWNDGRVGLISSGRSPTVTYLIGPDQSGENVFFWTRERLVGWDTDDNVDVYSARVGGGFPEPAPAPAECEGEGCRDGGTDEPEIAGAGSVVFQGAGNPRSKAHSRRCPANRLRRGRRCLSVQAIARKRCRRLSGATRRRCVRRQVRRLRKAQRRRNQSVRRKAHAARRAANKNGRAAR